LHHRCNEHHDSGIVIVGGGIAGLSMAWLLQRRGFQNITILESQPHLGGKIQTYEHDGVPHELGACYTQPAYHCIHELMRIFGINETVGVAGRMVHRDGEPFRPFGEDVIHKIRKNLGFMWRKAPSKAISLRVLWALRKYKHLHNQTFGQYEGQLPPQPSKNILASISIPFLSWLKQNNLDILIPIFRLFQSAQGYGYLENIPAFYALMWNTPKVIDIAIEQMRGKGQGAKLLTKGMSQIIQQFAQHLHANIICNSRVVSIHRSDDIRIVAENQHGDQQEYQCSKLFVSCSHRHAVQWLKQPTALEKELFSDFRWSQMTTSLYRSQQSHHHPIDSWFDNLVPGRDHHVITQRDSQAFVAPSTATSLISDRVVYQYGEQPTSQETIDSLFRRHYQNIGVRNEQILNRIYWSEYFPHWPKEGIEKANPWRLFNSQGTKNTWWIGSSACFESINDVVLYNLHICDRYFDS